MQAKFSHLSVIIFLSCFNDICSFICDSMPDEVTRPKSNDLNRFTILIQGNPNSYTPMQHYNITLKTDPHNPQTFKKFALTVEPEDITSNQPTGNFDIGIQYRVFAKFSTSCPNTIIESSSVPKTEVQVFWTAPPRDSGCIIIRGVIVVSEESWYSLSRRLCEDSLANENIQPEKMKQCCACNEAKYEVAFEGRWIKNTHPKNYPSDVWSTKFSDIIGASHVGQAAFWGEQTFPSPGMKELAESGNTSALEAEIIEEAFVTPFQSQNIRTIIKAKGLQYPYITQSSYAVFRVDKHHHRISLVSKIIPSPDWIVGVSDFELCTTNGSWLESYTYNLYPFDVGIDDGVSYYDRKPVRSRNRPITAISQNNPNDPRSPFFNDNGDPMKPIAKLHFRRQRLYEKNCDDDCEEEAENQSMLPKSKEE